MLEIIFSTLMITRKAPAAPTTPGQTEDNLLVFEAPTEFMAGDNNSADSFDNVEHKVKHAQEQLAQLRQRQEEIERQKQHLENLRLKQERFVSGKRDLLEKISRANSHVERELDEAQKRADELRITHEEFSRHIDILKSLQPEKWHRTQVDQELDGALIAIEEAEQDFAKGLRRLHMIQPPEPVGSFAPASLEETTTRSPFSNAADDLSTWLRRGFAFSLPLIGALFIAIVLIRMMF